MTVPNQAAKYTTEIVDLDYYRRQISCQAACPVYTDARGYVNAVADGEYEPGYISSRQPNPFASTCGRVCAAHCEKACRRGKIDGPVAIRALKRFLCESYGVEALSHLPITRDQDPEVGAALLSARNPSNVLTVDSYSQLSREGETTAKAASGAVTAKRVAVIGAGPAGLTAAHDLALLGHQVTVFEEAPVAGGMAILGIPEYRLPRNVLKSEIGEIENLGVEMKMNTRLGDDFGLADLREQGYQSIFLAIGAHRDRGLDVPGAQLDGVVAAVNLLLNVNLGYKVSLGDRVVVVGGGDVAVDAARIAARLGEDVSPLLAENNLVTTVDATRRALRLGVREVHLVYRGTREEMRASQEELDGAEEEGTVIHNGLIPNRILGQDGSVTGLETVATRSEYDENGRRTLVPVAGSESIIDCSSVVLAIGQQSDLTFIGPTDGIEISPHGTIAADPETMATSAAGIFAGGDVVYGPRTVIEAVADGHKAARGIDNYLKQGQVKVVRRGHMEAVPLDYLPATEYADKPRENPPQTSLDRRTGISEVELVYDEETAKQQSRRCLKCHIQTVFNRDLCILCGGCVDVCPKSCLKLTSVTNLDLPQEVMDRIDGEDGLGSTAMIKDEARCIRCGLCSRRCPVGAITMEAVSFEEELVYTGDSA